MNNAFGMKPDGTPFPANAGIFGNSPVLLGASTVCCPGLPFTASHDVGSTTEGGNVFAAMSGPVMQAGPGATSWATASGLAGRRRAAARFAGTAAHAQRV